MASTNEQPPLEERKHRYEIKTGFLSLAIAFLGVCVAAVGTYATSEANKRSAEQQALLANEAAAERHSHLETQRAQERFRSQTEALERLHGAMGTYRAKRTQYHIVYWQFVVWSAIAGILQERGYYEAPPELAASAAAIAPALIQRIEAEHALDERALACIIIFDLQLSVDESLYKSGRVVPDNLFQKHMTLVRKAVLPMLGKAFRTIEKQKPVGDILTPLVNEATKVNATVFNDLIDLDAKKEASYSGIFKQSWEVLGKREG